MTRTESILAHGVELCRSNRRNGYVVVGVRVDDPSPIPTKVPYGILPVYFIVVLNWTTAYNPIDSLDWVADPASPHPQAIAESTYADIVDQV
jgi:hypothetical protein